MDKLMRVGELAKTVGKTVRAIHLYEELGLLLPVSRSAGGYRLYAADAVTRVRWIAKLQDMGFSLPEVQGFLRDWEGAASGTEGMARVRAIFADKLRETRETVARMRVLEKDLEDGLHYPKMDGRKVFKSAVSRMPEVVKEALARNGVTLADLAMLVPHQANLRINEFVQRSLGLPDDKVYNNIQKYGNTTAATIPLCLDELLHAGRIKRDDLVCLVAFGAGFTWASMLIRW